MTSLSFINNFTNLQGLELGFKYNDGLEGFEKLQYSIFSQLKILEIRYLFQSCEFLIKFLENNGKNLKKFYVGDKGGYGNNSLNLAIAKFCPNLEKLSTGFKNDELETLKIVFNNC